VALVRNIKNAIDYVHKKIPIGSERYKTYKEKYSGAKEVVCTL
jgi:hypothetical protein